MRWSELALDVQEAVWTISASRAKNKREHKVPLTAVAISIIRTVPRLEGSDLVFTTDGKTVSSGWSKAKTKLDAAMPDVDSWTLHDLRRTCATGLARLRQPPHVIEAVLNHKSGQVSGIAAIYNVFEYRDEKAKALGAWERHFLTIVEGGSVGKVVAFSR